MGMKGWNGGDTGMIEENNVGRNGYDKRRDRGSLQTTLVLIIMIPKWATIHRRSS
jgi:hypothetical protein